MYGSEKKEFSNSKRMDGTVVFRARSLIPAVYGFCNAHYLRKTLSAYAS